MLPIRAIKDRLPIAYVLQRYNVPLEVNGGVRAVCPFHPDTNPSLDVYGLTLERWGCFACGAGGDVLVLAQMELSVFNELLSVHLRDAEAETIGGFVVNRLGRIPQVRDTLDAYGLRFTVEQAAPNRVIQLRVRRLSQTERSA